MLDRYDSFDHRNNTFMQLDIDIGLGHHKDHIGYDRFCLTCRHVGFDAKRLCLATDGNTAGVGSVRCNDNDGLAA